MGTFLLTAAHCVDGASYFDVMLGTADIRNPSDNRVEVTSYNAIVHPSWDSMTLRNDIALIQLPSPLELTGFVSPICLPLSGDQVQPGQELTVLGWGKDSDMSGGITSVLQYLEVNAISDTECNAVFGMTGEGTGCVEGPSTCNGDSGGPLMSRTEASERSEEAQPGQVWSQAGIVSFGSSSGCEVELPNGYTRVEYYLDWIIEETGLQRSV